MRPSSIGVPAEAVRSWAAVKPAVSAAAARKTGPTKASLRNQNQAQKLAIRVVSPIQSGGSVGSAK